MYTPSNSTEIFLSVSDGGRVKVLRYQPRPPCRKPVPALVPVPAPEVGSSSMLQSCGRSTTRQVESSKPGSGAPANAPVGSVTPVLLTSANLQLLSRSELRPPPSRTSTAVGASPAPSGATARAGTGPVISVQTIAVASSPDPSLLCMAPLPHPFTRPPLSRPRYRRKAASAGSA